MPCFEFGEFCLSDIQKNHCMQEKKLKIIFCITDIHIWNHMTIFFWSKCHTKDLLNIFENIHSLSDEYCFHIFLYRFTAKKLQMSKNVKAMKQDLFWIQNISWLSYFTIHDPMTHVPTMHDSCMNYIFLYMPQTDWRRGKSHNHITNLKYFTGYLKLDLISFPIHPTSTSHTCHFPLNATSFHQRTSCKFMPFAVKLGMVSDEFTNWMCYSGIFQKIHIWRYIQFAFCLGKKCLFKKKKFM